MTPGAVDLKIVRDRLQLVAQSLVDLRSLPQTTFEEFADDRRNILSADAALRRALEALFDIARHLLAKGAGVGSLEYRVVAVKTAEHGIVTDPDMAAKMVEMAGYRSRLTHHYDEITPEELYGILTDDPGDIDALAGELRAAAGRLAGGRG
jgi:uncharacterized protein YutE (UPF0331/DUF86 family)